MAGVLAGANQQLAELQAYCQDKFHLYRQGLPGAEDSLASITAGQIAGNAAAVARWNRILGRINTIPRAGNFQFILWWRARLRFFATARRVLYRGWEQEPIPLPGVQTQEPIKAQLNNFRNLLKTTFRYVKCVGWGRDGVLTLWRYRPSGGGQEHLVVMKQSARAGRPRPRRGVPFRARLIVFNIMREKDIMTMLCRAPHIVQRFIMADHPAAPPAIPGNRRSARVANMANKVDGAEGDYILMEYCKLGNLASQLLKAAVDMPPNNTERWLPEAVLWRIFDCLVKACMAMQCPPRYVPGNVALAGPPAAAAPAAAPAVPPAVPPAAGPVAGPIPAPLATSGFNLPETVAPGNGQIAGHRGLVHFDLDPTNGIPQTPFHVSASRQPRTDTALVFVRDFDFPAAGLVPSHTAVPRIQIGDFGATKDEGELWKSANTPLMAPMIRIWTRREKWNQRNAGKLGFSLPEQFGKDWDMIPLNQDPSDPGAWMPAWMQPWNPPPPITTGPGRYTSASNVWQIGMIMKVCMTLCNPDQPPYAGRMTTEEPPPPVGGPLPAQQQRWTYGWSLLDPSEPWLNKYQRPLIDLIARCLMAKQEFRPTLQQIQTIVTQQLAGPPAIANVPAYWTNTFFAVPQAPQPHRDTEFATPLDPFWDYDAQRPV